MKYIRYHLAIALIGILALSCKDGKDNSETDTTARAVTEMQEKTQEKPKSDWREYAKELEALTPLTKDAMESWLPNSIAGLDIEKPSINAYEDLSTLTATYNNGDTFFYLNVVDGAGTRGSQLTAPAHLISIKEVGQKLPAGYYKTIKKNGIIARERYEEAIKKYNIKFFYKNRLYVTIRSNLKRDEIWKEIEDLEFENLIN